jgi:hypothetical protein
MILAKIKFHTVFYAYTSLLEKVSINANNFKNVAQRDSSLPFGR